MKKLSRNQKLTLILASLLIVITSIPVYFTYFNKTYSSNCIENSIDFSNGFINFSVSCINSGNQNIIITKTDLVIWHPPVQFYNSYLYWSLPIQPYSQALPLVIKAGDLQNLSSKASFDSAYFSSIPINGDISNFLEKAPPDQVRIVYSPLPYNKPSFNTILFCGQNDVKFFIGFDIYYLSQEGIINYSRIPLAQACLYQGYVYSYEVYVDKINIFDKSYQLYP